MNADVCFPSVAWAVLFYLLDSIVGVLVGGLLGDRMLPVSNPILVVHGLPPPLLLFPLLILVLVLLFLLLLLLLLVPFLHHGRGRQSEHWGRGEDYAGEAHRGRVDYADGGNEAAAVPVAPLARQTVLPVSFG